jgi:NAD-dependent DNA ligase
MFKTGDIDEILTVDGYNNRDIKKKSMQSLLGICRGLIVDNHLSEKEFHFLRHWILEHDYILSDWPGILLQRKINAILEDGRITTEELEHFKGVLCDLVGESFQASGSSKAAPTSLPINTDAEIQFSGKSFCFTGQFIYGTRKACHEAVEKFGGLAFDNVKKDLDYLVIGIVASDSWVNTSYGRKILKAVEQQDKGLKTLIVNEEMWTAVLR